MVKMLSMQHSMLFSLKDSYLGYVMEGAAPQTCTVYEDVDVISML